VIKKDIYGYFDIPQQIRYGADGRVEFYGQGGYYLRMNNIVCHLDIFDNKLRGIEVNNLEDFSKNVKPFLNHLIEISVTEVDEVGKKEFISRINSYMTRPHYRKIDLKFETVFEHRKDSLSANQVNVVEVQYIKDKATDLILKDEDIYVSYEEDSVKLKYRSYRTASAIFATPRPKYRHNGVSTTILKFRFNKYMIDPSHLDPDGYGVLPSDAVAWMKFQTCEEINFTNKLQEVNEWHFSILPKAEAMFNFYSKALRGREKRKQFSGTEDEFRKKIESLERTLKYDNDLRGHYKNLSILYYRYKEDREYITEMKDFLISSLKNAYNMRYKKMEIKVRSEGANSNLVEQRSIKDGPKFDMTSFYNDMDEGGESEEDDELVIDVDSEPYMKELKEEDETLERFFSQTRTMSSVHEPDKILDKHPYANNFLTIWSDDELYSNGASTNLQIILFTNNLPYNPTDLSKLVQANTEVVRVKQAVLNAKGPERVLRNVPTILFSSSELSELDIEDN